MDVLDKVVLFGFFGVGSEGFAFGISNKTTNEFLAHRINKLMDEERPFEMVVTEVRELPETDIKHYLCD